MSAFERPSLAVRGTGDRRHRCPDCGESIGSDAINIREGVALCRQCGKLSRLSELFQAGRPAEEILSRPPSGCSISQQGERVVVSATLRSMTGFATFTGIALFWNALLTTFLLMVLAGFWFNLVGPLPNWFPAFAVEGGAPIVNDEPMDLGTTLGLFVFLIPFIVVGVFMIAGAVSNLMGRVEVVIAEVESYVATGVGRLRWKKRFDPRRVRTIEFGESSWETNGKKHRLIKMEGEPTVKFGSTLSDERLDWMHAVLQELLVRSKGDRQEPLPPGLAWLLQGN